MEEKVIIIFWALCVLFDGIWIGIIVSRHWLWKEEIEQHDTASVGRTYPHRDEKKRRRSK